MNEHTQDAPLDALGQPICVGQVLAHVWRRGSNLYIDPGVVLQAFPDRIVWRRVDRYYDAGKGAFLHRFANKPSTIFRTDHCLPTGYSEAWLRNKYQLPAEREEQSEEGM